MGSRSEEFDEFAEGCSATVVVDHELVEEMKVAINAFTAYMGTRGMDTASTPWPEVKRGLGTGDNDVD